jgi:hypothetical protein
MRTVTIGGVPSESEFVHAAGNRLYNAETSMVIAGEILLSLREAGKIGDADWGRVADASADLDSALREARDALLHYEAEQTDAAASDLTKALNWMDYIGRRLLAYTEGT